MSVITDDINAIKVRLAGIRKVRLDIRPAWSSIPGDDPTFSKTPVRYFVASASAGSAYEQLLANACINDTVNGAKLVEPAEFPQTVFQDLNRTFLSFVNYVYNGGFAVASAGAQTLERQVLLLLADFATNLNSIWQTDLNRMLLMWPREYQWLTLGGLFNAGEIAGLSQLLTPVGLPWNANALMDPASNLADVIDMICGKDI